MTAKADSRSRHSVQGVRCRDRGSNDPGAQEADYSALKGIANPIIMGRIHVEAGASSACRGHLNQETDRHRVGEYLRDQAHICGMVCFWPKLKRGHSGICYPLSSNPQFAA